MRKSIIAILMTFCLSIMTYAQTPRDRATELKEQAQSRDVYKRQVHTLSGTPLPLIYWKVEPI